MQRVPGDHGCAHGSTHGVGRAHSGRIEVRRLSVDDAANARRERDQAWTGAEGRGWPHRDRR